MENNKTEQLLTEIRDLLKERGADYKKAMINQEEALKVQREAVDRQKNSLKYVFLILAVAFMALILIK